MSQTGPKAISENIDYENSYDSFSALDRTKRPQDDFFAYVNGKWLNEYQIPEDKGRYGAFIALRDKTDQQVKEIMTVLLFEDKESLSADNQKIVNLYHSYMNQTLRDELAFKPLRPLLNKIETIQNYTDIQDIMAYLNQRGVSTPIGSGTNIDPKADNQYMYSLSQGGLGLPDRDYYLSKEEKYTTYQKQYREHIASMLSMAGYNDAELMAIQIYHVEEQLAQNQWSREDCRNVDKTYNQYSTNDLSKLGRNFNWQQYLKQLGVSVDKVCIRQPNVMQKFDALFKQTSVDAWRAYFIWQTLRAFSPYCHQAADQKHFEFYGTILNDIPKQRDKDKRAIDLVNGVLGEALGKHYVTTYFSAEAKAKMEALVNNLREAFKHGIQRASWMSQSTKQEALKKLDNMTVKVGYPDCWQDYSKLSIKQDDLVGNVIRANLFEEQRDIAKLNSPIDRDEWLMAPQTVNAYNYPPLNDICFPAAILQPPFFSLNATDAMNYGGIGAVIAHEMGHGFDDQGRKYNHQGKLEDWWQDEDAKEYQKRTDLLVAQYNAFQPLPDCHVNGKLTLGENVADLTGLSMALLAYKIAHQDNNEKNVHNFTPKQQVFLNYAQVWRSKAREGYLRNQVKTDPHSPGEYRCNGIVSNLNSFHKAFDVKPEDPMYREPEKRVKLWK